MEDPASPPGMEDVAGKDQQPCGEEDEPEITGEVTGSTSASAPAAGSSRKQRNVGGRPQDPIRAFFESTGDISRSQKRPPCKCKLCGTQFTVSQADTQNLKAHIANCKKATPEQRLKAQQLLASQTSTAAAAAAAEAAAAAAAGGVKRKASTQLSMERYTAGSHNALLPDQLRVAAQHLTRAIVSNNLPFKVTDCPHFQLFCSTLRPGYLPPAPTTVRKRLLLAEFARCKLELQELLRSYSNLTVSADHWTDRRRRSILGITVVFPDGTAEMLAVIEDSAERHTAENVASHIIQALQRYDITQNVGMLVTDNAANMAAARRIVVNTPGLQHVIPFRCYMHAFALLLGSIMSHPWASQKLSDAQKVVTYFQASHQPLALFRAAQQQLPVKPLELASSNTTRLTSVQLCAASVLANQATFSNMDKAVISNTIVQGLVQDLQFFANLGKLNALMEPVSWVIMAVQRQTTTLADVARYWHYLARKLGDALLNIDDADFALHVISAFHMRAKEMDVPLLKLALFLDPRYRKAAMQESAQPPSSSSSSSSALLPKPLLNLQQQAGELGQCLGFSKEDVLALFSAVESYAYGRQPFNIRELSPLAFWAAVGSSSKNRGVELLATIAKTLGDIKPTAATPEQAFSRMGWFHSKQRNALSASTNEMETTIKMHWERCAPVRISTKEKEKRAKFDAEVGLIAEQAAAADAAQLPAGVVQAVEEQADAVTDAEIVEQLSLLRQALEPPEGFSTWAAAVDDAFGGWDVSSDLMAPDYTEQLAAPAVPVRPATTQQFSVSQLLQQQQDSRQQAAQQQQQALLLQLQAAQQAALLAQFGAGPYLGQS